MDIQLIRGEFSANDALALITQMIHTKIKYHENKISNDISEEDVKYRESKIIHLQKELYELRTNIHGLSQNYKIDATIHVT
jgi:hypothetical protein